MPTEDKLWLPSLSPRDKQALNCSQDHRGKVSFKWTGFAGKTLWDWLLLLIQLTGAIAIPISLLVGVAQFNLQ